MVTGTLFGFKMINCVDHQLRAPRWNNSNRLPLKSMRLKLFVIFIFLVLSREVPAQDLQPVGQWRDHLPYNTAIAVAATDQTIWCATPYSIFSVDKAENSIERWSRTNGLSETGITAFGLNSTSSKIVLAYASGGVDILYRNDVFNIDDIRRSNINADKTITDILVTDNLAFLSAGLGIFVLDLDKNQVKGTYIIGAGGAFAKVNQVAILNNTLYAATSEGLKSAPLNSPNLPDFRSWQLISTATGLNTGASQNVKAFGNRLLVRVKDSLFVSNGNRFDFFFHDGRTIRSIDVSANKPIIHETGRSLVLRADGSVESILENSTFTTAPNQAIADGNNFWVADSAAGLSKITGNSYTSFNPNSPAGIATGEMRSSAGKLWVASGSVNDQWQATNRRDGLYLFSENQWQNYRRESFRVFDTLNDIISVAVDKRDGAVWAGSFGGGLLNIKAGNTFSVFKQNSAIQPAYFQPGSYRVAGLAFDNDNNLWISNYGANQPLVLRKADGSFRSGSIPFPLAENAVAGIVIDDLNQKWIISPKNNGLLCLNHGASIDNTADDQWKWYREGRGNGNLPSNNVLSIAKDKTGFIWIGTDRGIGLIQCTQQVFTGQSCEAVLPVVQQDNFAGYLFRDERVQSIAVDGADRKWIGTKNGVWLISATGEKTIYRFSTANSPLLNNDVRSISIDETTGEVFFATASGLCSFRSTATEAGSTNSNVLVFPNPVPPTYTGTIAIRGLANNSIVKITEMDGRLIYQTRALGGQAVWSGKDYNGRKISTGVYLVLVSDDARTEKMVTKIVFINK